MHHSQGYNSNFSEKIVSCLYLIIKLIMKRFLLIALSLLSLEAIAQETRSYVTETDDYIAWRPDVKLTFDMFKKSTPNEKDTKAMQDDNRKCVPYLGFYRILDVPKSRSGWKKGQFEKAYYCAMFSKHQSYMAERDTFDLQIAQAQWDILELGTRKSRMLLDSLQRQINSDSGGPVSGVASIFYETASQKGEELYGMLSYIFFKEVILPRDRVMYCKYRELLDKLLSDTAPYATSPEEAERFLLKKPLEKYLKPAKTVIGDLRQKE